MARPSAAVVVAEGADPSPGSALSANRGPEGHSCPPSLSLARVPFQGGALLAGKEGEEVWVPLRPLCDRLGVSYSRQLKKVSAAPWAVVAQKATTGADGKTREMVCLDLRSLPGWLFGLNASRVAPEARPALVAYQREAAEVLYRHFLAPPAPVKVPTIPGTIEAARIEGLEARVRKLEAKARKPAGAQVPRAARVAQLVPLVVELVSKQPGIPGATGAATVLRRRRDWVHAATRAALAAGILENRGSEKRPRLFVAGLAGGCA